MSLAQRSITAVAWKSIANWISWAVLFLRAVFLARWLPVDVFGVYAMATSILSLATIVVEFGMADAFIHRAPETVDETKTAEVHFTLKLIGAMVLIAAVGSGALMFTDGSLQTALLFLTFTSAVGQFTQTPQRILTRRVVHRRLSLMKIIDAVLTTCIVLGLAWKGATLWALLASSASSALIAILVLYVWKPVWRPRLSWSTGIVRYFVSFGSRSFLASVLYCVLDRVDDLWVGAYLGDVPLGFYSKAYSFATYPRKMLAVPVNAVAGGTYAALKNDRTRLSQAFFRVNALLVRSGFLLGGLIALIAPEFIRIVLGAKWMPMLEAFRLMLVFTLLDPIKTTIGHLFVAVGRPEQLAEIRLVQLVIMAVGLYLMGPRWGIAGVALVVDAMLLSGIGLSLWRARAYVDVSVRRLLSGPTAALIVGMILARGAILVPGVLGSDWRTGSAKVAVYLVTYASVLTLLERRWLHKIVDDMQRLI